MDPVVKRRMRTAHAKHVETCVCGKQVAGNGRKSHYRACEKYLAESGWPLADDMREAIFNVYRGREAVDVLMHVQRRLGELYLQRRRDGDRTELPWIEFRDLVWVYAAEVAEPSR